MKKKITTKRRRVQRLAPKKCYFSTEKKEPWFGDVEVLRRYLTERGKIIPRSRTGLCSKHQRRLTLAIKHARHLSLLPFVGQG